MIFTKKKVLIAIACLFLLLIILACKNSPKSFTEGYKAGQQTATSSAKISISSITLTPTIYFSPSPISSPTVTSVTANSKCFSINNLPDSNCTPGVIDPKVTQYNIWQTICVSGYTKTVRPSVSYANALKIQQIREYGYTDTNLSDYEEDHLIPLELGGSPSDPKNLWPEPGKIPNPKDKIENSCHDKVCNGQISLAEAQKEIATNWPTACQGNTQTIQNTPVIPQVQTNLNTSTVQSGNGATALCNDGTYSYAASHRGACSHHGGVSVFYK